MSVFDKSIYLSDDNISEFTEEIVTAYGVAAGKRATNTTKLSLQIEELLLRYKDLYGVQNACHVRVANRFNHVVITLSQQGNQIDPLRMNEELFGMYDWLSQLNFVPKYTYSSGSYNVVTIYAEKKPSRNAMLYKMLAALLLALAFCGILNLFPNAASFVNETIISPLFAKLTAVMTALATPLVFLGVVTGISGMGSTSSFGKVSSTLLKNMMITYFISAFIFTLFAVFVYGIDESANATGNIFADLLKLVLDVIPNNLVVPFTVDNDLQVIALAIFVGVVMLILGNSVSKVNAFFLEVSNIVNKMMELVCRLLPLMVFLGVCNLFFGQVEGLSNIYKMALVWLVASALLVLYIFVRLRLVAKVPIKLLFRKQLQTLMINLSTSSQIAALPENLNCCKNKFGIDSKIVDFAIPLGIVTYMPAGAIFLGLLPWSLAEIAGIPITMESCILILFSSIVIAIAAPPIPGSAFAVMPLMFSICGVPMDMYPLAVLMGTFIGYVLPAVNGYCMQLEVLIMAIKQKQINLDTLTSEECI